MPARDTATAMIRWGLGPRPGEVAEAGGDGRDWALAQLDAEGPEPAEVIALPPTERIAARVWSLRRDGDKDAIERELRALWRQEAGVRAMAMVRTTRPLRERLVAFFANHLAVSALEPPVFGLAGAYERDAIRPRVLGRFADLLLAAIRHPAMLIYLDNARSIGPDSRAGRRAGRGLNENLAREILELHTLGADGGYGQADVEALAAMLTGWTVPDDEASGDGEPFRFGAARHQPGDKTLLGRRYPEAGEAEARAALRDLAAHPSTARHVSRKLAAHFTGHAPASLVARMTAAWADTAGDLREVVRAMLTAPEADAGPPRLKSPHDLVISTARALGRLDGAEAIVGSLDHLGQLTWAVPSPAGWPDDDASWASPQAVLDRVEWSERVGDTFGASTDAAALADDVLGGRLGRAVRERLRGADRRRALGLFVASPEFQRR